MTRSLSWLKWLISLDLNIVESVWENVSMQVNKINNIVPVDFVYFNQKILLYIRHIVPLHIG